MAPGRRPSIPRANGKLASASSPRSKAVLPSLAATVNGKKRQLTSRDGAGLFKELAAHTVSRRYGNGQAIFYQGDPANAIFRVEQGNVKLTFKSARGQNAVISVLRAGECFGEGCLISNARCICTATSLQYSTIGRISKRSMVRRLHAEPDFAKLFTSHLVQRITRVEHDLADQLMNSSERRLARLLLQLCDFGGFGKGISPEIYVDQGTLAQAVGTTRSRVSYFMNNFRKQGFIDYNGSIRVHRALLAFLLADSAAPALSPRARARAASTISSRGPQPLR